MGASHQAAHRNRTARRRDAALVHGEEHRHPELQERSSLSDEEIAKIAKWADSGAPRGNPADMPPPRKWEDGNTWTIGTPDLIVKLPIDHREGEFAGLVGRDSARAGRSR